MCYFSRDSINYLYIKDALLLHGYHLYPMYQGCATPPGIADGQLVFSNGSVAEFVCDKVRFSVLSSLTVSNYLVIRAK